MSTSIIARASLYSLLALGAVAFAASPAHATLEIQVESGGVTDSTTGQGTSITLLQDIGNFNSTSDTGMAVDLAKSADISSSIYTSSGGELVVTFSANDFSSSSGTDGWRTLFSGNLNGPATVTLQSYVDDNNTLLGTGTLLATLTASSTSYTGFSLANFVEIANPTGSFAVTEILTINATGTAMLSLDGMVIDAVPEPMSLALLGSGLCGLVLARRRRA